MKISKWTVVRTVMLLIVVLNMILKACGIDVIDVSESQVLSCVETVIEIGTIAVSWWYNNSFSENARKADEFLKSLKGSGEDV